MNDQRQQALVSVIIPTFNAAPYLAETINSVLGQNWQPLEIIVVDDGSSDNSVDLANCFGSSVRVIAAPHRGISAARNRGIAEARGEYLLHLDADDLLLPGSIDIMMRHFSVNAAYQMVAGRLQCFLSPELSAVTARRFVVPEGPQRGHLPGVSIVRADVFRRYGGLDESYAVNADLEWWVRALDQGAHVGLIEDVVLRRRIHGNNHTILNSLLLRAAQLKTLRTTVQRRRAISEHSTSKENHLEASCDS